MSLWDEFLGEMCTFITLTNVNTHSPRVWLKTHYIPTSNIEHPCQPASCKDAFFLPGLYQSDGNDITNLFSVPFSYLEGGWESFSQARCHLTAFFCESVHVLCPFPGVSLSSDFFVIHPQDSAPTTECHPQLADWCLFSVCIESSSGFFSGPAITPHSESLFLSFISSPFRMFFLLHLGGLSNLSRWVSVATGSRNPPTSDLIRNICGLLIRWGGNSSRFV